MNTLTVTTRAGDQRQLPAEEGRSVMELLREGGVDELLALCGGGCSCATCHVYLDPPSTHALPPAGSDESALLDGCAHRRPASRLACQVVFVPALAGLHVTIAAED